MDSRTPLLSTPDLHRSRLVQIALLSRTGLGFEREPVCVSRLLSFSRQIRSKSKLVERTGRFNLPKGTVARVVSLCNTLPRFRELKSQRSRISGGEKLEWPGRTHLGSHWHRNKPLNFGKSQPTFFLTMGIASEKQSLIKKWTSAPVPWRLICRAYATLET